jgi:hypothetical protein
LTTAVKALNVATDVDDGVIQQATYGRVESRGLDPWFV